MRAKRRTCRKKILGFRLSVFSQSTSEKSGVVWFADAATNRLVSKRRKRVENGGLNSSLYLGTSLRASVSKLSMRYALCAAFLMITFICGSAVAQSSSSNIKLEIKGISPTDFGYEVTIKVTNNGTRPVVLMLSPVKKPKLQGLDVQQRDGKSDWRSVGPCLDLYTDRTTTLAPSETLEDTVPIGDTSHGWTSSVCRRTVAHLGGEIRPVLYCSFDSERQFRNRMKSLDSCKQINGPSFVLPPKDR